MRACKIYVIGGGGGRYNNLTVNPARISSSLGLLVLFLHCTVLWRHVLYTVINLALHMLKAAQHAKPKHCLWGAIPITPEQGDQSCACPQTASDTPSLAIGLKHRDFSTHCDTAYSARNLILSGNAALSWACSLTSLARTRNLYCCFTQNASNQDLVLASLI